MVYGIGFTTLSGSKKVIGGDLTGKKAGIHWEYMGAFLVIKADHSQDLIQ